MNFPQDPTVRFLIGPLAISQADVATWAIMAILVIGALALTRRPVLRPNRQLIFATLDTQTTEITGASPAPDRGLIETLFVFILVANWSSLLPGGRAADRSA